MDVNEGEKKKKKIYKIGDVVTFRLLKKQGLGKEFLDFINEASENSTLNIEIINALKLSLEFKKFNEKNKTNSEIDFLKSIQNIEEKKVIKSNKIETKEEEKGENFNEESKIIEVKEWSQQQQENKREIDNSAEDELFSHKPKQETGLKGAFGSLRRNR